MVDWMQRWREKFEAGLIINDPDLLIIQSVNRKSDNYEWGTVFYSKAREEYKNSIKNPIKQKPTFDEVLMKKMFLSRHGELLVAANPNSLFPGHLVIYPKQRRPDLTIKDLEEIIQLALKTEWTFIHNMENAAASITDWAHFQAYPVNFPICSTKCEIIAENEHSKISKLSDSYPVYGLVVESLSNSLKAAWTLKLTEFLSSIKPRPIPFNLIFNGNRIWLIPRSLSQSKHAASYIGGLELGGLFCLPNADALRLYLPESLRFEVRHATISLGSDLALKIEKEALKIMLELS